MNFLRHFWFHFCSLLIKPALIFVRPKVVPADYQSFFENHGDKSICYVLHHHSWSDRAVLERLCKENENLPRIAARQGELPAPEKAACLYVSALEKEIESGEKGPLTKQMEAATADGEHQYQFVPVSIFWGRSPGKETSIFKLLLGDAERAGKFRKLLIMMIRGRQVMINIGQPLDYGAVVARTETPEHTVKVLHRMIGFMFNRQKTATLGPTLLSRQDVVEAVLQRPQVQEAVARMAERENIDPSKAAKKARKMAEEIAANFDLRIIRFLEIVLNWVFQKIFTGLKIYNVERLRDAARRYHVIYMPAHRSHFDYLLISYTLFKQGLVPPHIAAGVNLNFPPVGGILRRGGAFYIRRSFSGQPLYTTIFKTYLDTILGRGYPVEFFPEGGRSRTGRLLQPKTGMLSMLVESFIGQPTRKAALVPVYIGYDKLVESGSYLKELRGKSKSKESAGGLLKATKIFDSSYGSPYVAFGEPMVLDEALSSLQADWRHRLANGDRDWLPDAVAGIAEMNMARINNAVVVSPVGLVAMIMLSSPQHALAEWALLEQISHFLEFLRKMPYSKDMILPEGTPEEIFEQAARTAGISRIEHDWGSLVTVSGDEAVLMTYYRNSVMHVLALPSLVARFFRHSESISERELVERCTLLYPFLKHELSLHYDDRECVTAIRSIVNTLVEQGMLSRNRIRRELVRPDVGTAEFTALIGLGRVLRETLERYVMSSQMLVQELADEPQPRKMVENNLVKMAERMAVLTGRSAPEFFDKNLFKIYLGTLLENGLLSYAEEEGGTVTDHLELNPRLQAITEQWTLLLGPNVQQNMQQLIREPNSQNQLQKPAADEAPEKSKRRWRRSKAEQKPEESVADQAGANASSETEVVADEKVADGLNIAAAESDEPSLSVEVEPKKAALDDSGSKPG